MINTQLDIIDKKLLNSLQKDFPLTSQPYAKLGCHLAIDESEVIHRIEQLKAEGIIRQISPVLDARKLGYQTTLVAMRVAETQLEKAERLIAEHPGVSHGYEREHCFNLWFTLAIPPATDIETELEQLTSPVAAEAVFSLPAVKTFKIGVYFDMEGGGQGVAGSIAQPGQVSPPAFKLSQGDRLVINEIQGDLPLISSPFTDMAARLDMELEALLAHCQSLLQRGIMRRFSASINHNRAGFKANAMSCWLVPSDMVDSAGQKLTSLLEVSHCYERKTNPLWRYNLFAMIHSHTREACQEIASKFSHETGLTDYVLLFATKEFRKTRIKYTV